jgi:hypothetical protein
MKILVLPTPADLSEASFLFACELAGAIADSVTIYIPQDLESVARWLQENHGAGWQVLPTPFFKSNCDWAISSDEAFVRAGVTE